MSDDKTHVYEETLNKTTSDPESRISRTQEKKIRTTPSGGLETYESHAVESSEESISDKAREAAQTLRDLIQSVGNRTRQVAEEKVQEIKDQTVDMSATKDARDIQALGDNIESLLTTFEDTMTEIRKEPYVEQERLLLGYKKLLEEQINVINARIELAKRLKPGA